MVSSNNSEFFRMSRSNFNLRKFIPPHHHHSHTVDEYCIPAESSLSEDATFLESQNKQQKSKSWAPARRPSDAKARRPSREETLLRRSQSIKKILSEAIPLHQGSPNSSSNSLSNYDSYTDIAPTHTRDGTLCSPRPQDRTSRSTPPKRLADRRHLCLPPLQTQQKQDVMPRNSPTSADLKADTAGHKDLSEQTAPRENITVPPQTPDNEGSDQWSLTVQQLIRETDEAFKAVGTAIDDAKMAVTSFPMSAETSHTSASPSPGFRGMDSPLLRFKKTKNTPPLPPLARPGSATSMARQRRRKSKKAKASTPRSMHGTRWQLGEEVADILRGPFFRKMEVDELLTPARLQTLRAGRESQAQSQSRTSSDTTRTASSDSSETPVEPFHLQDLPSRIGSAGVSILVTPTDVVSTSSTPDSAMRHNLSGKETSSRPVKPATAMVPQDDSSAGNTIGSSDGGFPAPPAKNPARLLHRPQAPVLPTIPEVVIKAPHQTSQKSTRRTCAPVDGDDFVILPSTNYTFCHPTIRHGPIRFLKSEVVNGMKIDPDDTMDWTAFQMAILGGAGDFFSDTTDFFLHSEMEEVADLVEWFDSFGFENPGLLVTSDDGSSAVKFAGGSPASTSSPTSSVATDIDLPIPVECEHPSGFWNEGKYDASKFLTQGCSIKRWTLEGHPKRYNRESMESLPPSPMLDLVMVRGVDGEPEMVPMGYNLGHDLGDFLKWEAEHVYAMSAY